MQKQSMYLFNMQIDISIPFTRPLIPATDELNPPILRGLVL